MKVSDLVFIALVAFVIGFVMTSKPGRFGTPDSTVRPAQSQMGSAAR